MLAIPAFRRLWLVTAVSATGDWLSLLALSALATQLATGYQAQSFASAASSPPSCCPLVLGPLAGALADKFDRRRVMVVCDLLRFGLFLSIPLVGSLWWLLVATLLIEICAPSGSRPRTRRCRTCCAAWTRSRPRTSSPW